MPAPALNLGVSLHCLANPCAPEHIAQLAHSAVQTLELPPQLPTWPRANELAEALKDLFATSHVRAESVHSMFGGAHDISLVDDDARRVGVRSVCTAVDMAADFKARFIVVHASAEPVEDGERDARLGQCRASLEEIGPYAAEAGVGVAVELLPRTCLGRNADELLALVDGLDSDVFGLCLDTNHNMDRPAELSDIARHIGGRLREVHVSDYDGIDEKHWMPGQGVVDWPALIAALHDVGFNGPFNYECTPSGESFGERLANLEQNFLALAASA